MENLKIRCKSCNKEIEGNLSRTVSCGCPNIASIRGGVISAVDLSKIVMLNFPNSKEKTKTFSDEDIAWQESRRQRKVRRLDFETR